MLGSLVISDSFPEEGRDIESITVPLYTRNPQAPNLTDINQIKNDANSQYDSLDNTQIVRENGWGPYWKQALIPSGFVNYPKKFDVETRYDDGYYTGHEGGCIRYGCSGPEYEKKDYSYKDFNKVYSEELTGILIWKEDPDSNTDPYPQWLSQKNTEIQ